MLIMLDCSVAKIEEYSKRYEYAFGQLRTPLTQYCRAPGTVLGVDNGCFTRFDQRGWRRLIGQSAGDPLLKFVTLPDVVGDAMRTVELFDIFAKSLPDGVPRCLVRQEGIDRVRIPWDRVDAVFVGGGDSFKCSPAAVNACRVAKMLGKWVHVGRVNSFDRAAAWAELAESCDGSGMSRFDNRRHAVLAALVGQQKELEL